MKTATKEIKRTIRPLGNHVLLKKSNDENKIGAIHIPDAAKNKHPVRGVVLAKGNADEEHAPAMDAIAVDDIVLFPPFGGTDVKLDGEDYLIIPVTDLFGVVEDVD